MAPQSYQLPRDQSESERLNFQHECYVKTAGYLLHPQIAKSLPAQPKIAEVGTGTGIWLRELASQSSSSWTFTGFDISDALFPPADDTRCDYHVWNILDPAPDEFREQFDVVHIRLLVAGLAGANWTTAVGNIKQLLKPGGWIQWHESNFADIQCLQQKSGTSTKHLRILVDETIRGGDKFGWRLNEAVHLLRIFKSIGLEQCERDIVSSDRLSELRESLTDVHRRALYAVFKGLIKRDDSLGWTAEDIEELNTRCQEEIDVGDAYYRWDMYIVIGRKP